MSGLEMFSLKGKTALVTGAAGYVGRQISMALAQAEAKTFIAGRSLEKLEAEASALRNRGYDVTALSYDQAREDSIHALVNEVLGRAERINVLVNNAVERPMKDWTSPAQDFASSMEVNATGLFLMIRTFGEAMAAQGSGSIINISSIQGMVGPDFTLYEGLNWGAPPDYFFHKGGLISLTRYAAAQLGSSGVRVNAVSAGGFFNHQDPLFVARYNARTLLGRMASQTDLMGAIVFLASDASAYITGANIPVDGGYTAK
jgi:NAD(P)-dependent dehydrogenase (short-subunit alcohol dehydrogenase family)